LPSVGIFVVILAFAFAFAFAFLFLFEWAAAAASRDGVAFWKKFSGVRLRLLHVS
jgi:hypothetical protein